MKCSLIFLYMPGIVLKLLRQISQETKIRVDEVKVEFPIKSKDYVRTR